mgnify:CR=1 FL=1
MKINNQYEEAEAIYPVTGLYIDPDGNAVEKSEMLLSEHRMDVYINDVLTMKLVCTPKDLPGLVLGTNGQRRHDSFIRGSGIPLYL